MYKVDFSDPPKTLYHYCDAYAFESIVRTNQPWLCPFTYSNDAMEGQACRDVLRGLGKEAAMAEHAVEQFLGQIEDVRTIIECFGMSLSERGDVLSQWRGYAADGAGFSIGFDRGALNEMPLLLDVGSREDLIGFGPYLVKVEYEHPASTERLRGVFDSARQHIRATLPGNISAAANFEQIAMARRAINSTLVQQWHQLFSIKGPAFKEEREWRIAFTGFSGESQYDYRVSRGMLVPYLKYDMPAVTTRCCPITRVVIGPKNPTPTAIVEAILRKYDHLDVEVTRSTASYR